MKILLLNKQEQVDLENIIDFEIIDYDLKIEKIKNSTNADNIIFRNHLEDLKNRAEHLRKKLKRR